MKELAQLDRSPLVNRAVRSCADCDREQAVEEADLGGRNAEHGISELLVLNPARTRVVAFVGDLVVRDRVNVDATDPVFAAAADTHDVFRNERLDLAQRADHAEFLLVVGRFGEHAEIEKAAGAVVEIDDDEGIVEDLRNDACNLHTHEVDVKLVVRRTTAPPC